MAGNILRRGYIAGHRHDDRHRVRSHRRRRGCGATVRVHEPLEADAFSSDKRLAQRRKPRGYGSPSLARARGGTQPDAVVAGLNTALRCIEDDRSVTLLGSATSPLDADISDYDSRAAFMGCRSSTATERNGRPEPTAARTIAPLDDAADVDGHALAARGEAVRSYERSRQANRKAPEQACNRSSRIALGASCAVTRASVTAQLRALFRDANRRPASTRAADWAA